MWPLAIASTECISDVSCRGTRARRLCASSALGRIAAPMCKANVVENQLLCCAVLRDGFGGWSGSRKEEVVQT